MKNLKQIDGENSEFVKKIWGEVEAGDLSVEKILGFKFKGAKVFIPRVPCHHVMANQNICKAFDESHSISIFSLTPVYDTLIYPMANILERSSNEIKTTQSNFKLAHGISLNEFITFVQAGRIIPYFIETIKNMMNILFSLS